MPLDAGEVAADAARPVEAGVEREAGGGEVLGGRHGGEATFELRDARAGLLGREQPPLGHLRVGERAPVGEQPPEAGRGEPQHHGADRQDASHGAHRRRSYTPKGALRRRDASRWGASPPLTPAMNATHYNSDAPPSADPLDTALGADNDNDAFPGEDAERVVVPRSILPGGFARRHWITAALLLASTRSPRGPGHTRGAAAAPSRRP